MATLINKVLNFVGWDTEEEEVQVEPEDIKEEVEQPKFFQNPIKRQPGKIVNINSAGGYSNQMKVVIVQPDNFDDAKDICDHLKNKKPVIVNLEDHQKESAQRVIDFLSGSVYALDGSIQKVSSGIFLIAPNNVDVMSEFKEELRNKGVFPWAK